MQHEWVTALLKEIDNGVERVGYYTKTKYKGDDQQSGWATAEVWKKIYEIYEAIQQNLRHEWVTASTEKKIFFGWKWLEGVGYYYLEGKICSTSGWLHGYSIILQ